MTAKTGALEKIIAELDALHNRLIDYDIECINRRKTDLMSGFHPRFYALRGEACAALSKEYPENLKEFKELCAYNQPIDVRDNIQAMAWPHECSLYLKNLVTNHTN